MNKDLYGHTVPLPEEVVGYLGQCFDAAKGADNSTEGYKRNQDLRDKREITYQQLKRMKSWFDNFNGHENDLPFILNGGHYVKGWVDNTLGTMRNGTELSKEIKSIVLPNQFIQPHEKNDLTNQNRPSQSHKSSVNRHATAISEDVKKINNLIRKII
jgi:hypothetical protein